MFFVFNVNLLEANFISRELFEVFFFLQMMVCLGYYSGGLGGNHVLRHGCSLILQLHLLYSADYCKYTNPHKLTQIYESVLNEPYRVFYLACG